MSWGEFFSGVVDLGKALIGGAAKIASTIISEAKRFVDEVWKVAERALRSEPETEKVRIERQLQDVNDRVSFLRKRYKQNGGLSAQETDQWRKLRDERVAINGQLRDLEQGTNAGEIVEKQEAYRSVVITDNSSHILQYHVGQSSFAKICDCGRPMVLQWDHRISTPKLKDYFWGCSGWYLVKGGKRACEKKRRLSANDLNLFANLTRPEFEVPSAELTRVILEPGRAKRLREALDSIRNQHRSRRMGIKSYRCPIHGESLVLKRKSAPDGGILDEYFLGCPRWLPDDEGCNFLVKLKSPAQISSVLDVDAGRGVLQTTG